MAGPLIPRRGVAMDDDEYLGSGEDALDAVDFGDEEDPDEGGDAEVAKPPTDHVVHIYHLGKLSRTILAHSRPKMPRPLRRSTTGRPALMDDLPWPAKKGSCQEDNRLEPDRTAEEVAARSRRCSAGGRRDCRRIAAAVPRSTAIVGGRRRSRVAFWRVASSATGRALCPVPVSVTAGAVSADMAWMLYRPLPEPPGGL